MTTATYTADHEGFGKMLNSDWMRNRMEDRGMEIKAKAEARAPIDTGRYIRSFHVRSHLHGGATNDRAEAIVYNDSPDAVFVEYGHSGKEPFSTLRDAAFGWGRAIKR
jgi:hypothetical protein